MTARILLLLAIPVAFVVVLGCTPAEAPPADPPPVDADSPDGPPIAVPPEDLKALVDGNNQFAIDLYKKLAEKEGEHRLLAVQHLVGPGDDLRRRPRPDRRGNGEGTALHPTAGEVAPSI